MLLSIVWEIPYDFHVYARDSCVGPVAGSRNCTIAIPVLQLRASMHVFVEKLCRVAALRL